MRFNAERILGLMQQAEAEGVAVLVFPELSLTGYTCADLFQHSDTSTRRVGRPRTSSSPGERDLFSGIAFVGLPLIVDDQVFNCAAVLSRGRLLGVVPKSFIPNYKEFYERRWFAARRTALAAAKSRSTASRIPFGVDRLFTADEWRRADGRRRNLRGPLGADPAKFASGLGRRHGAGQPVRQQ